MDALISLMPFAEASYKLQRLAIEDPNNAG